MPMTFRWCPNLRCPKVEGKAWPARYVVTKDVPGMPDVDPIHCDNCGARLTATDPTASIATSFRVQRAPDEPAQPPTSFRIQPRPSWQDREDAEMSESCIRCGRNVSLRDPAFLQWEAFDDGMCCPQCVTVEELAAIQEDVMATAEAVRACGTCGREAPTFDSGIPEDIGWYIVARGDEATLACPDGVTQDERDHAAVESVEALRWQQLLKGEDA